MTGFKDHFSTSAANYAAYRPHYPPALTDWLASVAPSTGRALDVGCGSGQLAVMLAEHFDAVVATDPSAQQIEHASPHPSVEYRVGPAERTGLQETSFDLITAAQAAHWFDLPIFFAEVRRLLKPDGMVALISYAGIRPDDEIGRIVGHFHSVILSGYWPPERALVDDGYRDIALPFTAIAPPALEIEARWPLAALIGYLDTWSAVRALERDVGRRPFDAVAAELAKAWGDPATVRTIRWPLTILAGRG